MYRGMRFEYLGKKLIHFHRSCSRYAEIPPGILSFPRRTEDLDGGRRISIARIRFLNKRLGVCSAQGTGEDSTGGSRLSNATRVLLYSRRKLREKWGGRVVGSTEFRGRAERIRAQREREREWSLLQTSGRRDDGEGRDDLVFLDSREETIRWWWRKYNDSIHGKSNEIRFCIIRSVS